jgi:hypothetical protein
MNRGHAACLIASLCLVLAAPPHAWAGDKAGGKVQKAKEYFDRGIILFNAGDYKGALDNFRISHTWRPHYKIRYNIGTCLFALGRYAEAGNELQAFLTDGGEGVEAALKKKVLDMLLKIQSDVSRLTVNVEEAGAEIWIDKKLVGKSPFEETIYVEPGKHTIQVKAESGEEWKGTYNFAPGKSRTVNVEFEQDGEGPGGGEPVVEVEEEVPGLDAPPPARRSGWKSPGMAGFYAAAGLAVACVVAASVTGGLALEKTGELEDLDSRCLSSGCDSDADAYEAYLRDKDGAKDEALLMGNLSTGFFAASGAAAIAAVVLVALFAPRKEKSKKGKVTLNGPWLAPGRAGAGLEIRF